MRRLIPPLAVSVPITIFSIAALALPLAAGEDLGQSERELSAWLLILYALPGLLSLALTFLLRIPLLLAWHTSLIVYFATLADEFTEAEIRGGIFVAGALMVLLGSTGMAGRIANLVPAPVVFAVVAGTVLPFVTRTFTELGNERLMIAAVLLAWLASRKVMGATFPAILPALIAGVTVAAARDEFGSAPANWEFPGIDPTAPAFSFAAILTVVPVFVALASFHANLTAVTYLRSQGYAPPARLIEVVTGCGSVVGSLFGPIPVNMGALVTPLTAGPEAGERDVRVWSVYFSSGAFLLIGLAGIFAARLPQVMPLGLLLAVAGLALVPVLAQALAEMSRGPVQLGPVLTFAVTVSGVSIFDLGSPFWGIVIGSATALLLDREQAVSPTATARPQPVTVDGS